MQLFFEILTLFLNILLELELYESVMVLLAKQQSLGVLMSYWHLNMTYFRVGFPRAKRFEPGSVVSPQMDTSRGILALLLDDISCDCKYIRAVKIIVTILAYETNPVGS